MTTTTDTHRAAHLRTAARHFRAARREILAAQLPPARWAEIRIDVEHAKEGEMICNDFAASIEGDERRETAA